MHLKTERPSQRLHHRVTAPLDVHIQGNSYEAADWSLGGFRISSFDGQPEVGSTISCEISVPFQGFDICFVALAKVVRCGGRGGELAAEFDGLDERQRELLAHFIEEIVRGTAVAVEGTLRRLDVPVTPVVIEADTTRERPVSAKIKSSLLVTLYVLLGGGALFYSVSLLYQNVFRLEVETAVVSAPIQPLNALVDGILEATVAEQQTTVIAGQLLFSVRDPELEEDVEIGQIAVERAQLSLNEAVENLRIEQARNLDYIEIALNEVRQQQAKVEALHTRLKLAEAERDRLEELLKRGHATASRVESVSANAAQISGELAEAQAELEKRESLLSRVERGQYFNGNEFVGDVEELQTHVDSAKRRVLLAQKDFQALLDHRSQLAVRAPTDGTLVRFLKASGSTVKRGEPVALFERAEERVIEAFLTQEEVMEIGLDTQATVFIPALGTSTQAHVIAVDRTSGFIEETQSQYRWRGPKDRSAKVTLAVAAETPDQLRTRLASGLPAVVIFERQFLGIYL